MKHQGYTIKAVKEQSLGLQGDPREKTVTVTSYSVLIGKKVVAAGLPSTESAKAAIETRRKVRTRAGLDPEG